MQYRTFLSILVLGFLITDFSGGAVADIEKWKTPLKLQLMKERSCKVKSFSRVRTFQLAGKEVIEGRAHCYSGLDYDFSWKPALQKFDIRRCQPVVC